jgi:hypothetical protein
MLNSVAVRLLKGASIALLVYSGNAQAASMLLQETFDSVNGPFTTEYCGKVYVNGTKKNCYHSVNVGVPTTTQMVPNNASGIADGADNNWYAAVFEQDDNGYIDSDVGVQKTGGNGNNTPVGLVKDDTGLLISFDASGMTNVTLSFDWRTFVAGSGDEFVVGYFVGDLLAGHPAGGFNAYREINLSNTVNASSALGGGSDGPWNWNPINGGNTGNWVELFRGAANNSWSSESFLLDLAEDESEVWIAFWLDNGNHDIGKFDNVVVMADPIPVPPAVWLFGSGLLGLLGVARRKQVFV